MKSDTLFYGYRAGAWNSFSSQNLLESLECGVGEGGGGGRAWENSCHTDYMGPAPMEEIIFFQVGISRA